MWMCASNIAIGSVWSIIMHLIIRWSKLRGTSSCLASVCWPAHIDVTGVAKK